jgi:hypothetical protein
MEHVIRPFEDLQCGAGDRGEERSEKLQFGQLVAGSLEEQHRHGDA